MTLIKSISGIRGTIGGLPGESLSPIDVVKYTAAYADWVLNQKSSKKVLVGRDARISGAMISNLVCSTLQAKGIDVYNADLTTTPSMELGVKYYNAGGGIIITASHNPIQWNALKLLNRHGEFISADDGAFILERAESSEMEFAPAAKLGKIKKADDLLEKHIEAILALEMVDLKAIREKEFKVVVDPVNSSGGIAVPMLLEALGVKQVQVINGEPNGKFAHNPEPLPENLNEISSELERGSYDLGIVVDPDVDRLAFVCNDGSFFGEEYTLVAVADYVLSQKKGNTVSNLSSTKALKEITKKHGGEYNASAVGEVNVVKMMKETDAIIGGEGNGGIIFPELHYGRDALVGIALFLSHLAHFGKSSAMLRAKYPKYHISKNKTEITKAMDIDEVLKEIEYKYQKQPINTVDGVKIEFDSDWVHLRKSNTEPIIRIYSESDSEATAQHLAFKIMQDIKEIISEPKEE